MNYPKSTGRARQFRLWDAQAKRPMRWRCYKHRENAHNGACLEMRWAVVGAVIEVYSASTGRLLGQYCRGIDVIYFTEG